MKKPIKTLNAIPKISLFEVHSLKSFQNLFLIITTTINKKLAATPVKYISFIVL